MCYNPEIPEQTRDSASNTGSCRKYEVYYLHYLNRLN